MKLTSVYYSPEIERITVLTIDDLLALDNDFLLNMFLNYNYELIGYFNDN